MFHPRIIVLSLPVISLTYGALLLDEGTLHAFIREDGIFETLGFLGLFITSLLFFAGFWQERQAASHCLKQAACLGLALLFFVGAGEEISWGQRILGIETPEELKEDNVQDEFNIHNLSFFEGAEALISVDTLFTLFSFAFTLGLPLLAAFYAPLKKLLPVPHWSLGGLFLGNFILARLAKIIFQATYQHSLIPFVQAVQEIKESNYALLLVLVAVTLVFVRPDDQLSQQIG